MDPKLRRIADYLLARLGRDDIDPIDIAPDLLPHFFILEIREQVLRQPPCIYVWSARRWISLSGGVSGATALRISCTGHAASMS